LSSGLKIAVADSWDYISSTGMKVREVGKEGMASVSSVVERATDVVNDEGEDISATATSIGENVPKGSSHATDSVNRDSDETVIKVRPSTPV
jgi:hypothetical protein